MSHIYGVPLLPMSLIIRNHCSILTSDAVRGGHDPISLPTRLNFRASSPKVWSMTFPVIGWLGNRVTFRIGHHGLSRLPVLVKATMSEEASMSHVNEKCGTGTCLPSFDHHFDVMLDSRILCKT